uniref:Uncharacterized protein n=1 Tax=Laticauda laticaudata TaxID=8630 RepID=A0A8C5RQL9_LATLA
MITLTHNYILKVFLVLVLFAKPNQSSVFRCSILHAQWKQLIQNNLPHLCRTNEEIPLQCIYELIDFNFPLEVLEVTNTDNAHIIYELLQQISCLLSNAHSYHAWNSTCFKNLKNVLHQQITNLETCLNATEIPKGPMNRDKVTSYLLTLKVKRYFQRMNNFLTVKQHSSCSWEMIHSEIKGCMLFITHLLKKDIHISSYH